MRNFTAFILTFLIAAVCGGGAAVRSKRGWIYTSLPVVFYLEEEHSGPFPFELGRFNVERDSLSECTVSGPGVNQDPVGVFHVDTKSGIIEVNQKVDYEKNKNFMLSVDCRGSEEVQRNFVVEIQVRDINDNPPVFDQTSYEASVQESIPQGTELMSLEAMDPDEKSPGNGVFTFRIISVSPETSNLQFFIKQQQQTGLLSFRGCLDFEEAQKYTVLVEAKDHGKDVQLSSTATVTVNILDNNDHMPRLYLTTGSGRVRKGDVGGIVYRVKVTDEDQPGSAGWRAKYTVHGEEENTFQIQTDPETNDGIVSVKEPLDFEEGSELTLWVSVENEDPFFSCVVKKQRDSLLWDVDYFRASPGFVVARYPLSVTVDNVNDPSLLTPVITHLSIMENTGTGYSLWTFTASDQDQNFPQNIRFIKGEDAEDWVAVDSETGEVSTIKVLDRESPFVINNSYTITVFAVKEGETPVTGTGTLVLHLVGEYNNVLVLSVKTLSMCLSDEDTSTDISAMDLDLPLYSGPFTFELLGDVQDWSIEPTHGTTVSLVKDSSVKSGQYELRVKVSDFLGRSSVQTLTVSVSDCALIRGGAGPTVGLSGTALAFIFIPFLLGMLLVICSCTCLCRNKKRLDARLSSSEGSLINYNEEAPGSDISFLI
ncbi:cadherin-2-like isoform X2 [Hoplias malabaricus]|uniref:cadherin-2-like isoform X2 n=1 Tax=Hoplias malabaricus TaxID=27720 RepID=UPI003462BF31